MPTSVPLLFFIVAVFSLLSLGYPHQTEAEKLSRKVGVSQQPHDRQLFPFFGFFNPSLRDAYIALQAWKRVITSDPNGLTLTWVGEDVCAYRGVFCAPPPDSSCNKVVAGIDLNHENIGGKLPEVLGLLRYLALFHINTNRFTGTLPLGMVKWKYLYELDVSNNLFSGPFPVVTLVLPSLAYLDVRFNRFKGPLPAELFEKQLDALFVNNNYFDEAIPSNLGDSPVSVAVFANNQFSGGIPSSVGQMTETLNEIIFLNNMLTGCIPPEFGSLVEMTVLDVSFNGLSGGIPATFTNLVSLEQLDVAHNLLSGTIPEGVCGLPRLQNFTASYNFFTGESGNCVAGAVVDDRENCINGRPFQRSAEECGAYFTTEQECPSQPAITTPPSPTCHNTPLSSPYNSSCYPNPTPLTPYSPGY